MTETHPPEPSMDEILASIRRIISEDEAAADGAEHVHGASHQHDEPGGDILVLTDPIPPDAPSPHDASLYDMSSKDGSHDGPQPNGVSAPSRSAASPPFGTSQSAPAHGERSHHRHDSGLIDRAAATEVSKAFEELHLVVDSAAPRPTPAVSSGGPTLEDITRDLLRPMIAAWLDEHLPHIVRSRVDEEIERITRTRVR